MPMVPKYSICQDGVGRHSSLSTPFAGTPRPGVPADCVWVGASTHLPEFPFTVLLALLSLPNASILQGPARSPLLLEVFLGCSPVILSLFSSKHHEHPVIIYCPLFSSCLVYLSLIFLENARSWKGVGPDCTHQSTC